MRCHMYTVHACVSTHIRTRVSYSRMPVCHTSYTGVSVCHDNQYRTPVLSMVCACTESVDVRHLSFVKFRCYYAGIIRIIFFFSHTCTFQLLDKPRSQVSSLLPPGSCLQFLSRMGFSNPTARRCFIECR